MEDSHSLCINLSLSHLILSHLVSSCIVSSLVLSCQCLKEGIPEFRGKVGEDPEIQTAFLSGFHIHLGCERWMKLNVLERQKLGR